MIKAFLVMAVAAVTPAGADKAQDTSSQDQETVTVTPDAKAKESANEVVCVRQQEIGSRLKARKVCKTRAEWEAEKREQRQAVDKAQASRWKSN
ncbi:hypothetical protein IDJ81_14835 [Tsuneonella flava]|uniref:Secreted protein n=1 Tax=Tsuneonella flava TaxID=2055955 RepID=A0ABX7KDE2_9SPHN|nr:hypothetical protein [Tsuneonella flava]QSB44545.1 hypothetical protein IDJ81_14835 [Tsuneonella flava]